MRVLPAFVKRFETISPFTCSAGQVAHQLISCTLLPTAVAIFQSASVRLWFPVVRSLSWPSSDSTIQSMMPCFSMRLPVAMEVQNHIRLRRLEGTAGAIGSFPMEPPEVRELALRHQGVEKLGIHSIEAENHHSIRRRRPRFDSIGSLNGDVEI